MILTCTPNPCVHKIVSFRGDIDGRLVIRPVRSRFIGGGKGINVARSAQALGADVTVLTTAGGAVGRLFLEGLDAEALRYEAVSVLGPTRMSTFLFGEDTGRFHEFLEAGPPLTANEASQFHERFSAALDGVDLVTLNGSVPDPSLNDFYGFATREAKARGVRVLLDSYGPPAVAGVAAAPYVVKANLDEVRSSFDVDARDPVRRDRFVRSLLDSGVEYVLLTDGARGAWMYAGEAGIEFVPPRVREVNPVGSGDAMLGAMVAALDRGEEEVDAVKVGIAAGAANAARVGVCDFTPEEVNALLAQVAVRPCGGRE